jgi:prepilin-type N-terminal cleavage/methylation domain-containing protein
MERHESGYTLVELVVVMLIFSIVMVLISVSFNRIVAGSSRITKTVETDIGGLIGLELLRYDLELAGFGLPWSLSGATYQETGRGTMVPGHPGTAAVSFNDEPTDAPMAYKSGDGVGYNGSDYLVLKGTALGMSGTSRSWCYLNYSSGKTVIKPSRSGTELRPGMGERAIVVRNSVRSGSVRRELVTVGSSFTLVFDDQLNEAFLPKNREDQYLVYGVAPPKENALAYPFNRSDYYISRTDDMTKSCARYTGVLYKTTIDHDGGTTGTTPYPMLDCVADLQVVFMMATSSDGSLVPLSDISGYKAEQLRELLKEVRVFAMVQQGKKEPGYSYPVSDPERAIIVGDRVWKKEDLLRNGWLDYRWKIYSIVVQPKNL